MTSVRRETGKRNKKAPNHHTEQQSQSDSGNEESMAVVLAELRTFRKEHSEASKDTKDSLARVESALREAAERTTRLEQRVTQYEQRLGAAEDKTQRHERALRYLRKRDANLTAKRVDLESRARRNNLRIYGVTEEKENNDMLSYISDLIRTSLTLPEDLHLNIVRAHRSLTMKQTDPRPVIVRFRDYRTKELVIKEAWKHRGGVIYNGLKILFDQDYTSDIRRKREQVREVIKQLKEKNIKAQSPFPAKLKIHLRSGTKTFMTLSEAAQTLAGIGIHVHLDERETLRAEPLRTSTSNRANVMTGADLRSFLHGDGEGTSGNPPGYGSLDGACITSALKRPSAKTTGTQKKQAQATILDYVQSGPSNVDEEHLAPPHTAQLNTDTFTEHHTSETKTDKTNWTPGENETGAAFEDITRREENVDHLQSQAEGAAGVKRCCVQLERRDTPQSLQLRPVRRNRGLKLKKILLKLKRGLCDQALPVCKTASRKAKSDSRAPQGASDDENSIHSYMAPITNCSEDDSSSYYSDEDSFHKTTSGSPSMSDSWSGYLDDSSSLSSVSSPTGYDSFIHCSNEEPATMGPKVLSAPSRKLGTGVKASTSKKVNQVYCFLCKKHVDTSLRSHMKTHFPEGDYACPRCDSRFQRFSSFKIHVRRTCYEYGKQQVDPEKPDEAQNLYKCDKCQEAFWCKVSLDRHRLTHDELYCGVCRKVLGDTAALARHKVSHTAFQCTRCEETFTLFMPLLRHCENVHKISRPFKCNRCPKTLPMLRFLILHEWTHTGHLPFQCAQCSCRFKSDADLIKHQRVHTKEKPFLCPECGKTFSQNSNLLRHLKLVHDECQRAKRHACSQCEKSFKEKGALKKHQRSKHLKELFRHPCSYCGKMVATSTLARHLLIHTGEKPFKCTVPECGKFFRSTSEVKKHVLIHHTTERPHKCDVCGKGFIKMCLLKAHAKIHSGEKPFVCHICAKAFPKLYSMQRHKKLIHTFVSH